MTMAAATARAPLVMPPDVRLMNAAAAVLFGIAALGVFAAGLSALARLPWFAIQAVRIEGEVTRNSVTTIRANAMPKLQGNFFTIDLAAAKRAFESVPWVRQAVVRRVWPNRLAVRLEEHRAVAYWSAADGSDRLVNAQGEVFDANLGDVEDDDLPTFGGPDGSSTQVLAMHARLAPLFAPHDVRIETLTLSGRGSWKLALDSGAEIELGRGSDEEVVARTERFVRTLAQVTAQFRRPLQSADLRHRDGYAVRLKGVETTDAPPKPQPPKR